MNNQVLVGCAVGMLFSLAHCLLAMEGIPVNVSRRQSGDIYYLYHDKEHTICNEGNNMTYMVSERRCVSDQRLFNGKVC